MQSQRLECLSPVNDDRNAMTLYTLNISYLAQIFNSTNAAFRHIMTLNIQYHRKFDFSSPNTNIIGGNGKAFWYPLIAVRVFLAACGYSSKKPQSVLTLC